MGIEYIEFMLSDFTTYKIDKNNILECNYIIKKELIDDDSNSTQIPIIESLLLIIDDYTKIINYDNENEFDINNSEISQIMIYKDNGCVDMAYIDLENKQLNYLQDNRVYITIEDKF